MFGEADAVAVAVEENAAAAVNHCHEGVFVFVELEGLGKSFLGGVLHAGGNTHDVGVGQAVEFAVGDVGGDEERHAAPFAEGIAQLQHLFDEVLGGFAVEAEEGEDAACVSGIFGEFDTIHDFKAFGQSRQRAKVGVAGHEGPQNDFLSDMLARLDGEELEAVEHGAVGVAIAGGKAIGAGLQRDGGGEGGHAGVVLEVEGAEVAVLKFLDGEVRVVDGGGGVFSVVCKC